MGYCSVNSGRMVYEIDMNIYIDIIKLSSSLLLLYWGYKWRIYGDFVSLSTNKPLIAMD
jgi:hypothetical protein